MGRLYSGAEWVLPSEWPRCSSGGPLPPQAIERPEVVGGVVASWPGKAVSSLRRIPSMTLTFLALAALLQAPKSDEAPKWVAYSSPAGFSVSMPGTRIEPNMKIANSRENGTIMTKEGDRTYLIISLVNAPPVTKAAEPQTFKEMRGALDKIAKVSSEKTITVEGHPGREFVYEMTPKGGDTLVVNSRYILASPEFMYNLQVLHVKDKPARATRISRPSSTRSS